MKIIHEEMDINTLQQAGMIVDFLNLDDPKEQL